MTLHQALTKAADGFRRRFHPRRDKVIVALGMVTTLTRDSSRIVYEAATGDGDQPATGAPRPRRHHPALPRGPRRPPPRGGEP